MLFFAPVTVITRSLFSLGRHKNSKLEQEIKACNNSLNTFGYRIIRKLRTFFYKFSASCTAVPPADANEQKITSRHEATRWMKIMNTTRAPGRKTDERKNKTGRLYMQSAYLGPRSISNFIFSHFPFDRRLQKLQIRLKTEQTRFYMESALFSPGNHSSAERRSSSIQFA